MTIVPGIPDIENRCLICGLRVLILIHLSHTVHMTKRCADCAHGFPPRFM